MRNCWSFPKQLSFLPCPWFDCYSLLIAISVTCNSSDSNPTHLWILISSSEYADIGYSYYWCWYLLFMSTCNIVRISMIISMIISILYCLSFLALLPISIPHDYSSFLCSFIVVIIHPICIQLLYICVAHYLPHSCLLYWMYSHIRFTWCLFIISK